MRFSAITALCAAPLALAGTLQADLVARGAVDSELTVRTEHGEVLKSESSKSESKGKGNGQTLVATTQITEVIIIWINNGGNAQTQTVGTTAPVAAVPAAVATHTVSKYSFAQKYAN